MRGDLPNRPQEAQNDKPVCLSRRKPHFDGVTLAGSVMVARLIATAVAPQDSWCRPPDSPNRAGAALLPIVARRSFCRHRESIHRPPPRKTSSSKLKAETAAKESEFHLRDTLRPRRGADVFKHIWIGFLAQIAWRDHAIIRPLSRPEHRL